MAKFTDKNGLDWAISIDLGTVWDYTQSTGQDPLEKAVSGRVPVMDMMGLAYMSVRKAARQNGFNSCGEWLHGIGEASCQELTVIVTSELAKFFPDTDDDEDGEGSDPQTPDPGLGKT